MEKKKKCKLGHTAGHDAERRWKWLPGGAGTKRKTQTAQCYMCEYIAAMCKYVNSDRRDSATWEQLE